MEGLTDICSRKWESALSLLLRDYRGGCACLVAKRKGTVLGEGSLLPKCWIRTTEFSCGVAPWNSSSTLPGGRDGPLKDKRDADQQMSPWVEGGVPKVS